MWAGPKDDERAQAFLFERMLAHFCPRPVFLYSSQNQSRPSQSRESPMEHRYPLFRAQATLASAEARAIALACGASSASNPHREATWCLRKCSTAASPAVRVPLTFEWPTPLPKASCSDECCRGDCLNLAACSAHQMVAEIAHRTAQRNISVAPSRAYTSRSARD